MNRTFKFLLALLFLWSNVAFGADEWAKIKPQGSDLISSIDNYQGVNNEAIDRLLSTYRSGCYGYYASASTLYVSAGSVVCSNAAGTLRKFRTNTSATLVTWANIDTGAEGSSTQYYYYAVADADSGNFTIMISANASAPSGVTYYKKLGGFYNNSSGNIEIGGIIEMYSGHVSNIPPGYVLCDGTSGTPNLRDHFIFAAGGLTATNDHKEASFFHLGGTGSTVTFTGSGGPLVSGTGAACVASSYDHMPPYYALAFIMRRGVE